jgi:hypothetical protein
MECCAFYIENPKDNSDIFVKKFYKFYINLQKGYN